MAVYTPVTEDQLRACLDRYGIANLQSWAGIAEGVENSNFRVSAGDRRYILTLYEKRVDPADLPFFLGLMDHLAARGIPCPIPLRQDDGSSLTEVAGRPAALITFLEGKAVRLPTVSHCEALGEAVAACHQAARDFEGTRPNSLGVDAWPPLFNQCREHADGVREGLVAEVEAELAELNAAWPTSLPRGVIHADLFPDNVFFQDGRLSGLIDFYFACTDAFAYDLAICLNAWCFEVDHSFNITKARALSRGYHRVRQLSADEMAALPILCRGATLRFLLTRLYDWVNQVEGAMVVPKDPLEYLAKNRFHRGISGPAAYGLG